MERLSIEPRPDWRERIEQLGFVFHTADALYWDESACYRLSAAEVDVIETATAELHRICIEAAGKVIEDERWGEFGVSRRYVPLIVDSWAREDFSLYGRFDLFYDGAQAPKMYEYNADTPTSLLEAAVIQWHWLEEVFPHCDQFNSLHEKLVACWGELAGDGAVHFACVRDHEEDFATAVYLEDTAMQAGLATRRLFIDEIGWNGSRFVDLEEKAIRRMFKLYPWEWLVDEAFSPHLLGEPWQLIEPAWKMLLSNKAILPVLWEMFPGHPNLLPAYFSPDPLGDRHVRKPALGREGANITLTAAGREATTPGGYGDGPFVYQAFQPLPAFQARYPVIGSWVIGGEPAGIGIRESEALVTQNTSRFIPHLFTP